MLPECEELVGDTWNSYLLSNWVQSFGHQEIDLLKEYMLKLPAKPVAVNIGAAAGCSTMTMLEARPNDVYIFSIDTDPDAGEPKEHAKAGLADLHRCVRLLGNSAHIGENFPYQIDLLFVDGDHTYEGVKADIEAWASKVYYHGYIFFHDYHSVVFTGVKQAVDEWAVRSPAKIVVDHVDTLRVFRVGYTIC